MDMQLKGKRAFVSGSNSGIGAEIARMLAAEGAAVVVHGRNEARARAVAAAICAQGFEAHCVAGDLDTDAGARDVVARARQAVGDIDILINNAGGRIEAATSVAWFDQSPDLWNQTYNRNVTSAVRLIHLLTPGMRERQWGRLIQIGSLAGHSPPGRQPEYAAGKAAMINLTLGLSKELTGTGITANTVSPGMILTERLEGWIAQVGEQQGLGGDRERTIDWILNNAVIQTVGRLGLPADIAFAVLYLSSPLADFVTGANIRVDGGTSQAVN